MILKPIPDGKNISNYINYKLFKTIYVVKLKVNLIFRGHHILIIYIYIYQCTMIFQFIFKKLDDIVLLKKR